MTQLSLRRRCASAAAAAVVLLGLTGCSSHSAKAAPAAPQTAPVVSTDAAALAALARATATTRALRSYAFRATQRLSGGARTQVTSLTGHALRPGAISYQLAVGGTLQQVIKLAGRTYVRIPPAGWKALAKPGPTVDPLASLLPLLASVTQPTLTGRHLTGQVAASSLSRAGLAPAGAAPNASTPVSFSLDVAGHVTAVQLQITVKAGTQTLVLSEATSFSQFNTAPAIRAPGSVRK